MSITKRPPYTIWLGGDAVQVGDIAASESITPGHLIERFNDSGTPKFRKHATAGGPASPTFALNQSMLNLGVDDPYAADDLVEALIGQPGTTVWGLIASGQNIVAGQKMESAGNGTLRALASGTPIALAIEAADATVGPYTTVDGVNVKRVKAEII